MSLKVFQSPWPQELKPTPLTPYINGVSSAVKFLTFSSHLQKIFADKINPVTKKECETEKQFCLLRYELLKKEGNYQGQSVQFKAPDGVLLDGMLFPCSNPSKNAILFALGEAERYESVANSQSAAHHFVSFFRESFKDSTILIINTRGIGDSEGKASFQGSSLDYYAAWSFLENQGYEEIIAWGHSLGGCYLLPAAFWKQSENPKAAIDLVSDRSFDNIELVAEESLAKEFKIVRMMAKMLIYHSGWGKAAQKEWKALKGKKLILHVKTDPVVKKSASLYQRMQSSSLPDQGKTYALELDKNLKKPHTRPYNEQEQGLLIDFVTSSCVQETDQLKKLKTPPKYPADSEGLSRQDCLTLLMIGAFVSLLAWGQMRTKND